QQLLELSEEELDSNAVPELATKRWARDCLLEWTEESPLFDVRVRGDFPRQSEWAVYPLPLLEARMAKAPPLAIDPDAVCIGIDPSGAGQARTTMCALEGSNVAQLEYTRDPDSLGIVLQWLEPWRPRRPRVAVDETGVGYGFVKVIADNGFDV